MKIKTNKLFWRLNNEFANILQKVRSFCPIVFQWTFIRGWYFAVKCLKIVIFRVQIGGGRLLEHVRLLEILLTKLLTSQSSVTLEYQTRHQSNAKT